MRAKRQAVATAGMTGIAWAILAIPAVAQACAVCFGSSPEDAGYVWGILFLMAMPFLVAGTIGGWILYCYHRRTALAMTAVVAQAIARMLALGRRTASGTVGGDEAPDGMRTLHRVRRGGVGKSSEKEGPS
jgi:hypothetical protein